MLAVAHRTYNGLVQVYLSMVHMRDTLVESSRYRIHTSEGDCKLMHGSDLIALRPFAGYQA